MLAIYYTLPPHLWLRQQDANWTPIGHSSIFDARGRAFHGRTTTVQQPSKTTLNDASWTTTVQQLSKATRDDASRQQQQLMHLSHRPCLCKRSLMLRSDLRHSTGCMSAAHTSANSYLLNCFQLGLPTRGTLVPWEPPSQAMGV